MASRTTRDIAPSSDPVTVTYRVGNNRALISKKCELLVVACDPRNLYGVCDYRPAERAVFKRFINFTFHTSLLKVTLKKNFQMKYGVIFAPEPLADPDGSIYGFRNESAKEFGLAKASALKENWVTVYQLQNYGQVPLTPKQFQHKLIEELKTLSWWPYGRAHKQDYEITDCVTTPYFDQFSCADLQNGLPWQFLNLQGEHKTIYVHASTCFESILHCWSYAKMLVNMAVKMPARRDAPIVILGAGASGILFADMLLRVLKYTNVEILEVTDRSDGKIHTIVKGGPYPPGPNQPTVCELGACYLSQAYDDFVKYLKPFLTGNRRLPLSKDENFRAFVTEGQFPKWTGVPAVMSQGEYIIQKAMHDVGTDRDDAEALIVADLLGYLLLRGQLLGESQTDPMPRMQPQNILEFFSKTFEQWLNFGGLLSLVGLFQYGYSVQGYGALNAAPAYYGMIWLNQAAIDGVLAALGPSKKPVVTVWSKGWGDIWRQMKVGKKIIYNAKAIKITRPD
jgi:hypothetical protein